MSVNHTNVDILDTKQLTNAPFLYTCKRKIGDITIPVNSFISIKVYVEEEDSVPCRIAGLTPDHLIITDASNRLIGYWNINKAMSKGCGFIYDDNGLIRGHIVADKAIPPMLKAAVSGKDSITTDGNDFILLPQCHVATFSGTCKSIVVNNEQPTVSGVFMLKAGKGVICEQTDTDNISISIYNNKKSVAMPAGAEGNGICLLQISSSYNDYSYVDVDNKHILLTNTALSNLRVVTTSGAITLKGVKDV